MELMELAEERCLALQVLTVQPLDKLMSWLLALVVGVVQVTQRELAARRRMVADPPAAWVMAVVLLDQLVHAGADRADDAELGEVGAEPRPEPVVGSRLVDSARVYLKPVPDQPRVDSPQGYARCYGAYQAGCDGGGPPLHRYSPPRAEPYAEQ